VQCIITQIKIRILGAHSFESTTTHLSSILIDGVLALDAGGLTSGLSPSDQSKLKAILLTHYHFDHIKDVASIGYQNMVPVYLHLSSPKEIYAAPEVIEAILTYILNEKIFPNFSSLPTKDMPSVRFTPLFPLKTMGILDYKVTPYPVNHTVPSYGYEVSSQGKRVFYTGDTGPGLSEVWEKVNPDLLITELSTFNKFTSEAKKMGHLTADLLSEELRGLYNIKKHLPRVILIHIFTPFEAEIKKEVEEVAKELSCDIALGYEGMGIDI
jgi:ribonuclease BN (tRNA processing enzyme)